MAGQQGMRCVRLLEPRRRNAGQLPDRHFDIGPGQTGDTQFKKRMAFCKPGTALSLQCERSHFQTPFSAAASASTYASPPPYFVIALLNASVFSTVVASGVVKTSVYWLSNW